MTKVTYKYHIDISTHKAIKINNYGGMVGRMWRAEWQIKDKERDNSGEWEWRRVSGSEVVKNEDTIEQVWLEAED